MIIVITTTETDEMTGKERLIVSHGVDRATGKQIILPPEHPSDIGAKFSEELHSWIIHK